MRLTSHTSAFTLVESIVAIALVGLGIATSIGALTKVNALASMGRNSTGAYTAVMNQIDMIQSYKPFNPLHRNENGVLAPEIPPILALTLGVPRVEQNIPIYKDPTSGVVVAGKRTTEVVDATPANYKGVKPVMYRATVTVEYTYLSKKIVFSMSTVRSTDE